MGVTMENEADKSDTIAGENANDVGQIAQNSPKVNLRARMEAAVVLLAEGEQTYDEIAKELGIDRKTLYNWRQDEEFRRAVVETSRQLLESYYPKFVRGLIQGIEKGDVAALRLYAQLMGEERKQFKAMLSSYEARLGDGW